jgi:glycosyltransferase involved in cell wall biosynthesis
MNKEKSLSFVLPMYNESTNIERTISLLKGLAGSMTQDFEIVVVDDASTDASAGIVQGIAKQDKRIKLFCLQKNTKFGGAFAKGFKSSSKEIIVYMDSDMPVAPEDIKTALSMVDDADIVTTVSCVEKNSTGFRKIISKTYNSLVRSLFKISINDINSGCKIVRRELVADIEFISQSPFVDAELFLHAIKKNARIKEYPLVFRPRPSGKSHIAGLPVILATFRDMIKLWFNSRQKI